MDRTTCIQLWVGVCPDCGIKITLEGELCMGRLLSCPNCDTNLGFVEAAAPKLSQVFEPELKEYSEVQIENFGRDWDRQPLPVLSQNHL